MVKYPSLKIAQWDNFQFGPISYLFQRIKLSLFAEFHAVVTRTAEIRKHRLKRSATKYPSLKIEKGGSFQLCSISHLFYRIKLPPASKFRTIEPTWRRYIVITPLGAWGKVPHSKNSRSGRFSIGVHILSFSAYQTAPFCKVSC